MIEETIIKAIPLHVIQLQYDNNRITIEIHHQKISVTLK